MGALAKKPLVLHSTAAAITSALPFQIDVFAFESTDRYFWSAQNDEYGNGQNRGSSLESITHRFTDRGWFGFKFESGLPRETESERIIESTIL